MPLNAVLAEQVAQVAELSRRLPWLLFTLGLEGGRGSGTHNTDADWKGLPLLFSRPVPVSPWRSVQPCSGLVERGALGRGGREHHADAMKQESPG